MNVTELERRKAEVAARWGAWTAHNIHLGHGVFTVGPQLTGEEVKARRFLQLISDLVPAPFDQLRIADLGCLEALYAIEFALRGASVVGIEGRRQNIERARFAKDVLGLDRLELIEDDVRHFTVEAYGQFDVVLCSGLLYHLDAPSAFALLESLSRTCRSLALIDTHVSLTDAELEFHAGAQFWVPPGDVLSGLHSHQHDGVSYWGRDYIEHDPAASEDQRMASAWASLDNPTSFWPTRPSLFNALWEAGFSSVLECAMPALPGLPPDRLTVAAIPGAKQVPTATDLLEPGAHELLTEFEASADADRRRRTGPQAATLASSVRRSLRELRRRVGSFKSNR
jgi:SAM-dependent methyltransferase